MTKWFAELNNRTGPGPANRTLEILNYMLNKAEAWGYRLNLRNSKAGPGTVWPGSAAREVISGIPGHPELPWLFWNYRYRSRPCEPSVDDMLCSHL